MRNKFAKFDREHPIPARYVQKRLRSRYRYPISNPKNKTVTHKQPEVVRLRIDLFRIKTPYKSLANSNIEFILTRYANCWALISDIDEHAVLHALQIRYKTKYSLVLSRYRRFVIHLMSHYQLNVQASNHFKRYLAATHCMSNSRLFYIVISDYSIQNAYYRLLEFQLNYCGMVSFLLYH